MLGKTSENQMGSGARRSVWCHKLEKLGGRADIARRSGLPANSLSSCWLDFFFNGCGYRKQRWRLEKWLGG